MAVPKGKISKQRRNTRKANWKASTPSIVECPNCHEMKLPHIACKKCGHYKGEQKIAIKKREEA